MNYIGIDISKKSFVAAFSLQKAIAPRSLKTRQAASVNSSSSCLKALLS